MRRFLIFVLFISATIGAYARPPRTGEDAVTTKDVLAPIDRPTYLIMNEMEARDARKGGISEADKRTLISLMSHGKILALKKGTSVTVLHQAEGYYFVSLKSADKLCHIRQGSLSRIP